VYFMDKLLKQVLKRITPTESQKHKTNRFIQNVMRISESILEPEGLKQVLAGSYTRDTWMKDKKEFDLFILFPENTPRDVLEKKGVDIGKKIVSKLNGKFKIAYAEHPYVRSEVGEYQIDIVPCYHLKSTDKIKSAVDRTPFHNRWLARHLKKELVKDVRLFKQFVKSSGVYGSDTRTSGLSGYLCELLVVHYGSFKNLIKALSTWEPERVFIDIVGKRDFSSLPNELKKRFWRQSLIMIDPTDKNRNVAAAFSHSNFMDLVYTARSFTKKPSASFFSLTKSKINITRLASKTRNRKTDLMVVVFKRPDIIDDVLWPQLRKTTKRIANYLEDAEFEIMNQGCFADEKDCLMIFELVISKLPNIRKIKGPPVYITDRANEFINKYKSKRLWIEDDYWFAEIPRKFVDPRSKLKNILKGRSKHLLERGIGSHISKMVSKKYILIDEKFIFSRARKNSDLAIFLNDFFEKRIVK